MAVKGIVEVITMLKHDDRRGETAKLESDTSACAASLALTELAKVVWVVVNDGLPIDEEHCIDTCRFMERMQLTRRIA